MGYRPLEYAALASKLDENEVLEDLRRTFSALDISIPENTDLDGLMEFALSPYYLLMSYDDKISVKGEDKSLPPSVIEKFGKFIPMEKSIIESDALTDFIQEFYHTDIEFEDLIAETRDFFCVTGILSKWCKNKQVYKIDKDFAKALLSTDNLKMARETFMRLPSEVFYIDLTDCYQFYPAIGAYVYCHCFDNVVEITTLVYVKGESIEKDLTFSVHNIGLYNSDDFLDIKKQEERTDSDLVFTLAEDNEYSDKVRRNEISYLAMQLINYISCKEADIVENPATKATYKKTEVIKNKFSEVQQWDVGVRYGKSIRQKAKEYEKEHYKIEYIDENGNLVKQKRKSPVAHFRCAHWHHFWHNKEDGSGKERILHWIEPVFVGGNISKDVVMHKVEG